MCPTLCNPMDYYTCQVLLSMEFSRQEYWSGMPCPLPGDLPDPGIELTSLNVSWFGRWVLYHSVQFSLSVVSDSLRPHGLQPVRLLSPWDSPGKNTGVGCCTLFQEIFPTQGSNPRLVWFLHCRWILCHWPIVEAPASPTPPFRLSWWVGLL